MEPASIVVPSERVDGDPFWMQQHGFTRNTQFFIVGTAHPNASLGSRMTIRRGGLTRPSSISPHARYRFRSASTLRPLPYGGLRQEHEIRFEIRAMRRFTDVLLDPTASTEIYESNAKPLDDTVSLSGSLIFD